MEKKKTWSIKYTLFIAEVSFYFHISLWNLLLSARGLDICFYICFFIILIENIAIIVKHSNCRHASDYIAGTELGLWVDTKFSHPLQPLGGGMSPGRKITEIFLVRGRNLLRELWEGWYGVIHGLVLEGREHQKHYLWKWDFDIEKNGRDMKFGLRLF